MASYSLSGNAQHLIFQIVEYGLKQQYFTIGQLIQDLKLNNNTAEDKNARDFIRRSLTSRTTSSANVNHLIVLVHKPDGLFDDKFRDDWVYTLLPNAIVQYVDYLEIIEARRNAKDANVNAGMALSISNAALAVTVIIGIAQLIAAIIEILRSN